MLPATVELAAIEETLVNIGVAAEPMLPPAVRLKAPPLKIAEAPPVREIAPPVVESVSDVVPLTAALMAMAPPAPVFATVTLLPLIEFKLTVEVALSLRERSPVVLPVIASALVKRLPPVPPTPILPEPDVTLKLFVKRVKAPVRVMVPAPEAPRLMLLALLPAPLSP